eukprot:100431-Alexandrium_andersonii.AAC.1
MSDKSGVHQSSRPATTFDMLHVLACIGYFPVPVSEPWSASLFVADDHDVLRSTCSFLDVVTRPCGLLAKTASESRRPAEATAQATSMCREA